MNDYNTVSSLAPQEQRGTAMAAHLVGLFFGIIGALIFWVVTKDGNDKPFVQDQAKEVLNFQITVTLAIIASSVLMIVLIGFLLLPCVGIAALVLAIIGAMKANSGETYRYPFILRLVK